MILMMIRFYALLFAGWLLIPHSAYAEPAQTSKTPATAGFNIKILQSLFESMKRGQAYAYARHHLPEMEGDPYFDYFYGVSAIDSGHASEGVFALERVLVSFPDDQVARLELARGYFILQEYAEAKSAFETVLATNPPKRVKDTAEAYIDRIRTSESRYRPTHSGFLEFTIGSDDNVNAGVDESTEFLSFSFTGNSLAQDDNFTNLLGSWSYSHPFSPGWLFETTLTGNFRKNLDLDLFDTSTLTLQTGITHLQASSKYKTGIIAQQFNLDGDDYRSLAGIHFDWQYTLSEQSSLNTSLQYAQLDYTNTPLRNSDLITLGINYVKSFSVYLQPVFFVTTTLGTESAEDNTSVNAERDIYSLRSGLVLSFTNTLALQTAIGTQNSQYPVPQFAIEREDDYNTANIGLLWAFARKWRLSTQFNYSKNDSNLDLYDYERNVFEMTLNHTF